MTSISPTSATQRPPRLKAVLNRVKDVTAEAAFFAQALGCAVSSGPRPGWQEAPVGWGQSLYLAPGGSPLPVLHDRWEQQGIIPILKTMAVDDEATALDRQGMGWVNRQIDYEMMGHARLAYFLDPENHPIGIQQRMADTKREEDLRTNERIAREGPSRWLGIGWLIFQVDNLHQARDFYAQAFGWPEIRGTEGFGHMMGIDQWTMLQIAFKGKPEEVGRDLSRAATLPVLETTDVDGLLASVARHGGTEVRGSDGFRAFADPEGHAWLIEEKRG